MTTRILLAIAILVSVAACKVGGDETNTGAAAVCADVGTACAGNGDCCSYGCLSGLCAANPVEGGTCRTSNDCAAARLCKSGACTTATAGMCRDTADVCTTWSQCCSGNCEAGDCTTNRAPTATAGADVADAPYTKLFTLANGSSDPDLDPLSYGWSFVSVPAGSLAALSSQTAYAPTFTPDRVGRYVVRLVVTEGPTGAPDRYVLQDEVTIDAVNRAPVATVAAPAGVTEWSRNVSITLSGAVSDPDGDTLECAWRVTAPGETTPTEVVPFATCTNPSASSYTFAPPGEGAYLVELVVRDHDRTTATVVNTSVGAATFTSVNDAPVPAFTRQPAYYANMGATLDTTPAVTLDASPSTDPNGDHLVSPYLSFFWELVSYPGAAAPAFANGSAPTQSFTPNAEGTYVFQVRVSDATQFGRASASATAQVSVDVGRYVQPLGHTVADSARAKDVDTIVLAGVDPTDGTKGMVWVYDMTTATEGAGIRLVDPADATASGIPRHVDVTPDGTKVVVVDTSISLWIVTLGATPSMVRVTRPFAIGDVVVAGNRYAYLYGSGDYDTVRQLDLNSTNPATALSIPAGWAGYGRFGAAWNSATTSSVYRVDNTFHNWYRYGVNNSGASSSYSGYGSAPSCGGYPASYATAIWATQNATLANAYVISSCGHVYRADTLADLSQPLGLSPSFVDSTSGGAMLAVTGTQLALFNSTLQRTGTDLIPLWASDGYGPTAYPSHAYFDAAGTRRFAVVSTTSPPRHGIVTFP